MRFELYSTNNAFGIKFWEGWLIRDNQKISLCISLSDIRDLGVAKTLRSTRKVEAWLNSEEGSAWVNERLKDLDHTLIGTFL